MVQKLQKIFDIINIPLGWLLEWMTGLFANSFAVAVLVFTIFINVVCIPLSIKSQKSSVGQIRIKPKLDELKKKCGDDRQKYSMEMQKLYQEENISMSGGCLPMLIRLPLMMSVYYLVRSPLTYLMHISKETISSAWEALVASGAVKNANYVDELAIIDAINKGTISSPEIAAQVGGVDFNLFGIDLTQTPHFSMNIFADWKPIWLIPIFAFLAQMLVSVISMMMQKKINPDAPSMAGMMLTMPLMSLFIGFTLPGGVGFYWICSSIVSGAIQTLLQYFYSPYKMLANERAKSIVKVYADEQKYLNTRVPSQSEDE